MSYIQYGNIPIMDSPPSLTHHVSHLLPLGPDSPPKQYKYIDIYIQKATASAADLSKSRLSAVWLRFWGRLLEALADPGCFLQGFCGFGVHWAGQGSKSMIFGTLVQA